MLSGTRSKSLPVACRVQVRTDQTVDIDQVAQVGKQLGILEEMNCCVEDLIQRLQDQESLPANRL
jgi:hypothetical protein